MPSCNHCCSGKAISIAYSECVFVALCIQYAVRMRRIILSSVASLAVQYFCTLSHKDTIFKKRIVENEKCILIFSTILSETFLILRRIERDMITNVYRSACKLPVFLVRSE